MNHQQNEGRLVLALSRPKLRHHFDAFAGALDFPLLHVDEWHPQALEKHRPAVLLTVSDDWYESDRCIRRARELGIPSLLIMDGIVEWRHQWEDPRLGAGEGVGYYQPVTTDKIACLGRQSVRLLESWGNVGKCELVGCPRMDPLITEPVPPPPHPGRKRLLVMTANTPGFTAAQIAMVERSLADLKAALGKTDGWLAVWRTKEEIKAKLSLTDGLPELAKLPLRKALEAVDAVVTTPSSAQLEAMLAQRPTVLLDYSNSPHYLEAAWCITAHDHIQPTLQALARPEPARLLHQDFILHDALECHTPAAPRMARLIQLMVERFQANGGLSQFPRLLPAESVGCEANPTAPDLHRAYGANPVLTNSDVVDLQRRLVFAQQEIRHLRYSWGLLPVLRKLRSVFRGGGKTQ